MKPLYKPLPAIAPENITLLLGENIGMNIDASLDHAIELASSAPYSSVLYLNTVQAPRWMYESARSHGLDPDSTGAAIAGDCHGNHIQFVNIGRGALHTAGEKIEYFLSEGRFQYVIVNSWEFAAKNSRYREEAVFFLKDLISGMDHSFDPVSVVVYGEELTKKTRAQKIQRGGYGKLAGLAKKVEVITLEEEFKKDKNFTSEVGDANSGSDFSRLGGEMDREEVTRGEERAPITTEESSPNTEIHFAPVFVPRSGGRPSNFSHQPIHLNDYHPDKPPVTNPIRPSANTPT